jgi:hypothetical protein
MASTTDLPKAGISLDEHKEFVQVQAWEPDVEGRSPSTEERQAQKSLLWKLDLVILPLLSLSYLMAYMVSNHPYALSDVFQARKVQP